MAAQKPKIIYWKPGGVIKAQQVYLDANFLLALSVPGHLWHTQARGLLEALQARNTALVLSSLALNEVIYQLLRLHRQQEEAGLTDGSITLPWQDRLNETVLKLPNLKHFEPGEAAFHRQTIRGVSELGLDPTDAFHYEAAHRLNCPLVSNDVQFQRVPDPNLTIITFF